MANPIPAKLTVEVSTEGEAPVVRCSGKLTAGFTDDLYNEVRRLIPNSRRVVVDLTDLTQMDSMGLGTIVRLYVSAKSAGCNLELVNLSKRVRELFRITNLLTVFEACGEHQINIP